MAAVVIYMKERTMRYIAKQDFFSIRRASIITDNDRIVLTKLYQPLIAHQGLAFFLTLEALHDQQFGDTPLSHEDLMRQTQMTINDLSLAKAHLEAVGLIKSYYKQRTGYGEWVYELYAPKTPAEFFADVVFSGMLAELIGTEDAQKWRLSFAKPQNLEGFEEISATFGEVFHPDFTKPAFGMSGSDAKLFSRQTLSAQGSFDRGAFIAEIAKKSQINTATFKPDLLDDIEKKAALYGIDELAMAELIIATYTGDVSEPIDFRKLTQLVSMESKFPFSKTRRQAKTKISSDTNKAMKIKLMEETSPLDYFRIRNFNNPPASADIRILGDIQKSYDLPLAVINALVDYVLEIAEMTFPRALVEKVAAALARSRVGSALEAMEYLKKTTHKKKKAVETEKTASNEKASDQVDIDALLESFEREKGSK